jgi:hypothetical protein
VPPGEGRELDVTSRVEALDRVEEPDRAFLDEILGREPEVVVTERYRADERQVCIDDSLSRTRISSLRSL